MIPVVGSPVTLGLLILSFILGFLTNTVLPFEYKRLRRQSTKSAEEVKEWNRDTLELIAELRGLCERLEHDRSPNLKETADDVEDIRTRIKKHKSRAPRGASDDVSEKLGEIESAIGTISYSYSDFYTDYPDYPEALGEIPFESSYDSIKNDDGEVVINRLIRMVTDNTLHNMVLPRIDEIEEELDSTEY